MNLIEASVNGVCGLLSPQTAQFFLPVPRELGSNPESIAEGVNALLSLLEVGAAEEVYLLFQEEEDAQRCLAQRSDSRVGICVMEAGAIRCLRSP